VARRRAARHRRVRRRVRRRAERHGHARRLAQRGANHPVNGTVQELIAAANQHYDAAQQALRNGDLATYQKEMNVVGQILIQIQTVLGTPAPSGQ